MFEHIKEPQARGEGQADQEADHGQHVAAPGVSGQGLGVNFARWVGLRCDVGGAYPHVTTPGPARTNVELSSRHEPSRCDPLGCTARSPRSLEGSAEPQGGSMGIFQRAHDIAQAKANKALDAAEKPDEMLDLSYEKMLEQITQVRRALVDIAASRKSIELQSNNSKARSTTSKTRPRLRSDRAERTWPKRRCPARLQHNNRSMPWSPNAPSWSKKRPS